MRTAICAVCLSLFVVVPCQAQGEPPPPEAIKVPADSPNNEALPLPAEVETKPPPPPAKEVPFGKVLRDNLLQNLPREIVVQHANNWGQEAHIPSIQGLRRIEVVRNHGNWERMKLICRDVPHRLRLIIDHVSFPEPGRMIFVVHVDVPADLEFDKQIWQNGVQIFGSHNRGRVWFKTVFAMETIPAAQGSGFRMFDAGACSYRFAPENVNGAGGDLAKMFAANFQQAFMKYQNGLEKDMLARLRAAMLKADESPEVAVSWSRLHKAVTEARLAQTPLSASAEGQFATVPAPAPVPVMSAPCGVAININLDFLLNGHRTIPVVVGHTAHAAGSAVLRSTATAVVHTGGSIIVGILSSLLHAEHAAPGHPEHKK